LNISFATPAQAHGITCTRNPDSSAVADNLALSGCTNMANLFDVAPTLATMKLLLYFESRKDIANLDPMAWKYVLYIVVATASPYFIDCRAG